PRESIKLKFFKLIPELITIRKCEQSIIKRLEQDPLQSAFSYIDLCMGVDHPILIITNLIIACLYLYKAMKQHVTNAGMYAYRSTIFDLSYEIFSLIQRHIPLQIKFYVSKLLFTVIICSNQLFKSSILLESSSIRRTEHTGLIISKQESRIIEGFLTNVIQLSQIVPFIQMPTTLSSDIFYLTISGQNFLVEYLKSKSIICDNYLYQYYLFEVHGMTINIDSGDIEFLFERATTPYSNLFDLSDVDEVFSHNLTYAAFSLEHPTIDLLQHPFHEMKFLPTTELSETNYLMTLLHTDYLLKMMSSGIEISTKQSFLISNEANFMKRLPQDLQYALKRILQQQLESIGDKCT
ncbi:unnamed protein product, partial [Didymodactylos carnosus]